MRQYKIDINNYILDENIISSLSNIDITKYEIAQWFEEDICKYTNKKYCVCLNSASTAIWLGLMALGLKEGDEVLIPGYSYPIVTCIAKFMKLNYKCIDIKLDTLCMDPNLVKENITNKTKAVIFINHVGYIGPDVFEIKQICDEYNCYFIEDSANGIGNTYNNIMCGTIGEFGVYSFNWYKLIRTSGGGCLVTDNKELYTKVKQLSWPLCIKQEMYEENIIGGIGTFNMPPLNAYIGIKELKKINILLEKRMDILNIYKKYLNVFYFDNENSTSDCVYLSDNAENICKILNINDINYVYKKFKYFGENNIVSKKVFENSICLPYSYDLNEDSIKNICNIIKEYENKNNKDISNLLDKISLKHIIKTKNRYDYNL